MGRELLLAELHAHTTWSDGELSIRELVDLYGAHRFDVLCVTDHVRRSGAAGLGVKREHWYGYVNEIDREAERARRAYGLLLLPGAELTDDHDHPSASAHVLALGLRRWVGLDEGLVTALRAARAQKTALVAAHPYGPRHATSQPRTQRLARDAETLLPLIDRWELFDRDELFSWVARRNLGAVATGNFHRPAQLASWKTLLPCERDERVILDFLRSEERTYLVRWAPTRAAEQQLAA
jgi:predicted metal-dependent phosphoesterase TrpH